MGINLNEATPQALAAVKAAKNGHRWGWWAARQYAEKRGVTPLMWYHALRIECGRFTRRALAEMHRG